MSVNQNDTKNSFAHDPIGYNTDPSVNGLILPNDRASCQSNPSLLRQGRCQGIPNPLWVPWPAKQMGIFCPVYRLAFINRRST
jgi:hypothetical protein